MGGSSTSTSTENAQQRYAPWIQEGQQDVAGAGFNMNSPFVMTPQFGIAPQTADQLKAYDLARQTTKNVYGAPDLSAQVGLLSPQSMTAAQIGNVNVGEFMNPYMSDVVDTTRRTMQGDFQDKDAAISATYAGRAGLGGSGEALARGQNARGYGENLANTTAKLRADAFNTAAQLAMGKAQANAGFQQQAGLLNANTNNEYGLKSVQLQDQLRNNQQSRELAALQAVLAGGNQQQKFAQGAYDYPFTALDRIAKYIPQVYDSNKMSQKTTEGGDGGMGSIIGAGVGLLGKALPMLAGLSEDDKKTNVEYLGTEPRTGLKVYASDYKADVGKGIPKRVTYMASDVEKKYPQAVERIGKTRIVNYGLLGDMIAAKKKAA